MRKYYLLLLYVFSCRMAMAQKQGGYTEKDYARRPLWIQMTDDTTANYFEAQKAFNIYFKHHELPKGEDDVIGEKEEREKFPSRRAVRKKAQEDALAMQVKKYERWKERMLPYVQQDGSILYPYQRLQIWEKQQELLRKTDPNQK